MLAALILVAQLAVADSIYATPALRAFVERAAANNRLIPGELESYRARLESEMAFVARNPDGVEAAVAVEQIQNEVRWQRTGEYEQRVTGYRSQAMGLNLSALGFFRQAWTVPVLYGNRLSLFFGRDTSRAGVRRRARRPTIAIHPLAEDREEIYRYSGGDTVATMRIGGRDIRIVRVDAEPHVEAARRPTVVFRGELDLDAERAQVIRMRGHFLTIGRKRTWRDNLRAVSIEAIAYVELVNAEIDGRFWLPSYQRVEVQASLPRFGDARSVFRIVSRFRRHEVNDVPVATAETDTLVLRPHRLTFAPSDSIGAFADWQSEIGDATGAVHADDFDDVAPDIWRPTGKPRVDLRAQRFSDFVHFNRVEGVYTGLAAELRMRDAAPGVTVRGTAGWAWSEATLRGRLSAEWKRKGWTGAIRGGRSLDITNDFRSSFDSGTTLGALIWSYDPYDYVDRRSAIASLTRELGERAGTFRIEGGLASDRGSRARVRRGIIEGDSSFRPNRGVDEGRYVHSAAVLDVHPDVNAEFMRPGVGAQLAYRRGDGDLDWQRIDLRLVARRNWRAMTFAARLDAGAVVSDAPPAQQLFELGEDQNLPGYDYKEFAGDRAAVARGLVMYTTPLLRAPIRTWRRYYLPAIAPAISAGVQSGWAEASSPAARSAIARLGLTGAPLEGPTAAASVGAPVSRPTDGVRTTVDLRLRFFGGAVSAGWARAVDTAAPWKFVFGLATEL